MKIVVRIALVIPILALVTFFGLAPRYVDRSFNAVTTAPPYLVNGGASKLHRSLTVVDLHADLLLWSRDPLKRYARGHTDVPRLIEGNVALQVFAAVTKSPWGQNYERNEGASDRITPLVIAQRWPLRTWTSLAERALYQADRLTRAAASSEGRLTIIKSKSDLHAYLAQREPESGMTAGLLAVEGLHAIEGDLDKLDALYVAGYRMMAPTHFFDTAVGGSAHGIGQTGLTPFGCQVIQRMEELGIIVDLAHVSAPTMTDVLAMVTRPVVVSHTGVKATCAGPRNLSDAQIDTIAGNGGVIGIGFWRGAVCGVEPADIVRAVRYVVDRVGIGHVALGSDFDGSVTTKFDTTGLALVTEALLEDGFTHGEIEKIMGGNVIRLLYRTLPA